MKDFAHGLVKLDADLRSRGVYTTDEVLTYKLLYDLPEEFDTIRYNLLEKENLSFTEVVHKLIADSDRKDNMRLKAQANSANGRPRPKRKNPNEKERLPMKDRNPAGGQTPKPAPPADKKSGGSSAQTTAFLIPSK